MDKTMSQILEMQVQLPSEKIHLGSPYMVTVHLKNPGSTPVLINPRLAVGYRNHLAREIFVEMNNESGHPVKISENDYNRDFLPTGEFTQLQPGDSISTKFDLFDWYLPKRPGRYTLVIHYQADEDLADAPEGVIPGITSAGPFQIEILPPKVGPVM